MLIYLFNLRPGVLIKTLSHIWGRLNLPIIIKSRVINPNENGFLDIPRQMGKQHGLPARQHCSPGGISPGQGFPGSQAFPQ